MSTVKNIAKNGSATVLQKFVLAGQQLFLVPFFIRAWGPEYYGEWLTLTAIPAALAMSDMGFGTAFANEFVLTYVKGDKLRAANLLKTGMVLVTLCCLVVACLSLSGVFVAKQLGWFSELKIPEDQAIFALSLILISRFLSFFLNLGEGLFRAARLNHRYIHIFTLFSAARIIIGIGVLSLGENAVTFALCDLICSLSMATFIHYKGRSFLGSMPNGQFIRDRNTLIPMIKKGGAYMLTPLQQGISLQGTSLIVRLWVGAEAVALFNSMRTLSNSAHQLLSIVNSSLFPELQLALGEGRTDSARKIYNIGVSMAFILGLIASTGLLIIGPWVFRKWTDDVFSPAYSLWLIFALILSIRSFWWTAAMTFRAANKPGIYTMVSLVITLLGIPTSIIFANFIGIPGVLIGCLSSEILMMIYVFPASAKLIKSDCLSTLIFIKRVIFHPVSVFNR